MKLKRIIQGSEHAYVYMERYINNGSPSGFDKKHTSSKYTSPRSRAQYFNLLVIRFDESIMIKSIGEDVDITFTANSGDEVRFDERCVFCHPDNLDAGLLKDIYDHFEVAGTVKVAPTASARSVKLLGTDYFIKLDYMGYLGRIRRNLDYQHLLSSYEVTKDICSGIDSGVYNERFGVLREDKGRVAYIPQSDGGYYEFGYLIREATPYCRSVNDELFLIPGFSLFAKDTYAPNARPIILQLLDVSGKNVNDFAFCDVMGPILDCYFDALVNHGFGMEAHAQNTLIAINRQFEIKLIVFRDMESVDKDLPLRDYLGVSSEMLASGYKCIRKEDYNYTIKHSFMFDFKLGEYLLCPLIELFATVDGFDRSETINKMKAKSRFYIQKLPEGYFPDTWYNYENKQFREGEKRPYISNEDPKFR